MEEIHIYDISMTSCNILNVQYQKKEYIATTPTLYNSWITISIILQMKKDNLLWLPIIGHHIT